MATRAAEQQAETQRMVEMGSAKYNEAIQRIQELEKQVQDERDRTVHWKSEFDRTMAEDNRLK